MASLAPSTAAQGAQHHQRYDPRMPESLASLPSSPPALASAAFAEPTPKRPHSEPVPENDEDWQLAFRNKVLVGQRSRTVSIGRSSNCTLQIGCSATSISRQHASIVDLGNGRFELRVQGMNGVRVNGALYLKGARVTLASGDQINFVGIRFKFRAPAAATMADRTQPGISAADPCCGDADDWWPEPVRKRSRVHRDANVDRATGTTNAAALPDNAVGRAALGVKQNLLKSNVLHLPSEEGDLYQNSTDTLVGGSEAGIECSDGISALNKHALLAQIIDDLPPSSPPPMNALADMLYSDQNIDDELLGPVDIMAVTPARSGAATPAPTSAPQPLAGTHHKMAAAHKAHSAGPVGAQTAARKEKQHGLSRSSIGSAPARAKSESDKENSPRAHASKQHKSALPSAAKQRRPPKAAATTQHHHSHHLPHHQDHGKATRPGRHGSHGKAPKTEDKEIMDSLRELLGIVDPSECLADSIDSETEEFLTNKPTEAISLPTDTSLVDLVVSTMVFSARTSHTISDLLRDLAHAEGAAESRVWRHHVTWTLFHNRCFGRVERRVKDASDKRVEDKWYYDASKDDCVERRENFGGLVRTARRCTLRDTQYFFKQVPKLPSFRYK
ncbi:hypothetical protein GQ54DRAFT_311121 [Martensiomyces pterosporus]|nr:hypothetical protein GQ54DRAFT_311121 [Martensiomyces pterosporus]